MPINAEQQARLDSLSRLLSEENAIHNLTRITDPQEIQLKHFADSLAALPIIEDYIQSRNSDRPVKLIDIGSGAGFPWLALAVMLDNVHFTSVEATGKKVAFQEKAAALLGLTNYEVINGRAEELGHDPALRGKFDIATARALGSLAMITELAIPLLKCKGMFLTWKGPKVAQEIQLGREIARKIGARTPEIIPYNLPGTDPQESNLCFVKVIKSTATHHSYPRPFNIIKKNS